MEVATRLGVSGPSTTARIQELAAAGLLRYTSRRGAILTDEGSRQAAAAIHRKKLIERFLAAILALPVEAIADETELFDRYASERVMDGIAQFLAEMPVMSGLLVGRS